MKRTQFVKLLVSILLPLGIGAIAGISTSDAVPGWYAQLKRPSFNPPNWLFGPVWTALYLLMGFSLFLIWKQEKNKERNRAIGAFLWQLALNFAWSFIFFYFQMIGLAFIEIVLLWVSIVIMLILFYKVKPMAATINVPYFLWVTFAMVLNGSYYVLNRA